MVAPYAMGQRQVTARTTGLPVSHRKNLTSSAARRWTFDAEMASVAGGRSVAEDLVVHTLAVMGSSSLNSLHHSRTGAVYYT